MPKNFSSGEVNKTQYGSVDQKFYYTAVQKADGFIVTPEGTLTMCPGTTYVANTKSNNKARLEPFIFSEDDAYILEITLGFFRFYRANAIIGAPYTVAHTYTEAEIFELDISVQLNDTLYITHPNHQRAKLVRSAHDSWTLSDLAMTDGPFRDENTTAGTIAASAITGAGITITAANGATPFTLTTDVNSIWRISHNTAEVEQTETFDAGTPSGSTTAIYVQKDNQWQAVMIPNTTWDGDIEVQLSYDNSTWWTETTPITGTVTDRQNVGGTATDRDIYVRITGTRTAGNCKVYVYASAYVHHGIVKLTAVASTTSATATVLKDLISTNATTQWSEGCWSGTRGFPTTSFFYDLRLCHAGNAAQPQQIWGSEVDNFESHDAGVLDTDAFQQRLDGTLANPVRWVRVHNDGIIVGTLGQVLLFLPRDVTATVSPTNPFKKRTSASHANGFLGPVEASGSMLMTEYGGKSVKELLYSEDASSMVTPDLTRFVKHLTHVDDDDGIVDIAFQRRPFPILWCVRSDGVLLALTYDRSIEQVAWTRINLVGSVESVAVIPKGTYDEVWISASYTINSSTVRLVGYMDEFAMEKALGDMNFTEMGIDWEGGTASITAATQADPCVITLDAWPTDGDGNNLANGDNLRITGVVGMTELNNLVYTAANVNVGAKTLELQDADAVGNIDSTGFTAYTSGGTLTEVEKDFSGLDHLEGEEVYIALDGSSSYTDTVDTGVIALDDYYNSVKAGLYTTREVKLLPYEGPKTLGRNKQVSGQLLGVFRTIGGQYGPAGTDGEIDPEFTRTIDWSSASDAWDWDVYEFTGVKHITDAWGTTDRHVMIIQQIEPLPMTLLFVEPDVEDIT